MSKKTKRIKEEEIDGIFLKDNDLLNLELLLEKRKNQKLELEKKDEILKNAFAKIELIKFRMESFQRDTVTIRNEKQNQLLQYRQADKEYQDFIEYIKKEYKIKTSTWGFNPDSGEIKINDEGEEKD